MTLFLLFLAVLPAIILGYIIYSNDKIEKEPVPLLVKLVIGGVGSVVLTLIITYMLMFFVPFFGIEDIDVLNPVLLAIYVFVGIALIEEFSKWFFLCVISWNTKAFNHVYDAIVYAVFVSLGFAAIENVLYVLGNEEFSTAVLVALNRMVLSVPGHAFFGVMMGYYLGLSKLTHVNGKKEKSQKYLLFSLLIPTLCHFLFDYILMSELSIIILFFYVIILYTVGIMRIKQLSGVSTNLFNRPNKGTYEVMSDNLNNNICYCKNCGSKLMGPYCGYCGTKNY